MIKLEKDGKSFSYEDSVHIDYILYGQFIKYDRLAEIVSSELIGYTQDKIVNVYIDLYQTLLPIYRFYQFENNLSITSCLINMAIHFRNFFRKYGVYSNIFLVYSPTMSVNNTRFCAEYNNRNTNTIMNNKQVYNVVNDNIQLLGTIIPYLPDIYFKIGTVETTVIVSDMISKFAAKGFNPPSIFVTNSQYAFQLPALNDRTHLFFKKKDKEGRDLSYGVNKNNALDMFIAETRKQHVTNVGLNQDWISGFMTLAGLPKRDIKTLMNYKSALKVLHTIREAYNVITPEVIYETVSRLYEGKINISLNEIANRFCCLDLRYQVDRYNLLPESQETTYLRQLQDPDAINQINNEYFKKCPIMTDKL